MTTTFEAVVRSCIDGLEELLQRRLDGRTSRHQASAISEFVFGFEQDRFFVRWTDGNSQRMPATFVSALGVNSMHERLELPALVPTWEAELDEDDRLDLWSDHWRPTLELVHLLAGALAVYAVVKADARGSFATPCRFALSKDVENDFPIGCDQILDGIDDLDDEATVEAVISTWFARPVTRAWFDGMVNQPQYLTFELIAQTKPDVAAMSTWVTSRARTPSPLESLMRQKFSGREFPGLG